MKKDNNKKRWFYDLTEKQVEKIIIVVEIVILIPIILYLANIWWPSLQPKFDQGDLNPIHCIIFAVICVSVQMIAFGILLYLILWLSPKKQYYLFMKNHEKKVIEVREKFGLGPKFKEILHKPEDNRIWFAKEVEDGILLKYKEKNSKKLHFQIITNYLYFDSNYQPKI